MCYQKICEGYESRLDCVVELDDKKKMMERPRAGKKKFKVRAMHGWRPLYHGCYIGLEGCYILLPSQAGIMHRHTEETKEEMKTMVHGGRV